MEGKHGPGSVLQAGEGRGSCVKAKSSSKQPCPSLLACVGAEIGLWETATPWSGIFFPEHGPWGTRPALQWPWPEQLSRAGICAGHASVQSSACLPRTSFAAVLNLGVRDTRWITQVCRSCRLSHSGFPSRSPIPAVPWVKVRILQGNRTGHLQPSRGLRWEMRGPENKEAQGSFP